MNHLGVFAKFWCPGEVKTRLAKAIGAEQSAKIYLCFLKHILRRFANIDAHCTLWYWPASASTSFSDLLRTLENACRRWELVAQCSGNLGQRMECFFDYTFACGAQQNYRQKTVRQKAVLIGSDSPDLPEEWLTNVFHLLDTYDVVIGPCDDGGYYLIGMSNQTHPIFQNVKWSSHDVLIATMDLLERHEISYYLMPPWYDIDDVEDLRNTASRLAASDLDQSWQRILHQQILESLASKQTPKHD